MDYTTVFLSGFFTWARVIGTIVTIAVAAAAWFVLKKVCKSWTKKEAARGSKSLVAPVIWSILRPLIIILACIVILGIFGINITSAVAGLGLASAIIGLALQDILKDVIMGIHIATDKFFTVGDSVIYNGELGVVVDFNLRTTKIRSIDAPGTFSICNRKIEEIKLAGDMAALDIPVPYEVPVEEAEAVFEKTAEKIAGIEEINGCTYEGIENFADSAIIYRFFLRTDPMLKYTARRKARHLIKEELDAEGIVIPFNQLDVHIVNQDDNAAQ